MAARRSPSSASTRSWRRASEPEPWWQKSGGAWQEQNWWQERPRGWQDTSAQESWHDQSSGRASDVYWQDTRKWQSGRASAASGPPPERVRGAEEQYLDSEVLRCPWPGPFTNSFPPKGDDGDWWSTKELAAQVGLVTLLR